MITAVLIPLNFLVYQLIAFIEGTSQELEARWWCILNSMKYVLLLSF